MAAGNQDSLPSRWPQGWTEPKALKPQNDPARHPGRRRRAQNADGEPPDIFGGVHKREKSNRADGLLNHRQQ